MAESSGVPSVEDVDLSVTGEEDLLDLLEMARQAMHDAVPAGQFVDVRPIQREVLAAWLRARDASVLAEARADAWDAGYEAGKPFGKGAANPYAPEATP